MYTPPFTITDEILNALVEISKLLPPGQSGAAMPWWDAAALCAEHMAIGASGRFRTSAPNAHWIPVLVDALLAWVRQTPCHPLIRGAVLHYELLQIRPFDAGNEQVAERLHCSALSTYSERFSAAVRNIPAGDYARAMAATDATEFISLTLCAILAAVKEPQRHAAGASSRRQTPAEQLLAYIQQHPGCKRSDLMNAMPSLSPRMLDRHLQTLKDSGDIEYRGSRKTGAYYAVVTTR